MISGMDEKFVFLVNGTTKTLANPKKKSRKHIQIICKLPVEVMECFVSEVTDVTIKKAIKTYRLILKEIENKEENPLFVQRYSHFPSENKEDL